VEGTVMKQRLVELGCPEDKIHVVPLCLKIEAGNLQPRAVMPRGKGLVIGFVGRLVEKKGFVFALRNLAPLLKANPELRVVIVGDGEQRARIQRVISEHTVGGQVTLKGMLPYEDMLAEVRAMEVLVVPSHTASNGDSEGGAPAIVAEAQIIGTPIIASDHADIPFALSDHHYMFKERNDCSFITVFTRFLREEGKAYDIERARAHTLEKYDKAAIQAQYARIYGLSGFRPMSSGAHRG
jgi:colanic acid/amylovoran biosynthesis glycosyltransferase